MRRCHSSLFIIMCMLIAACATPLIEPQGHVYSIEVPNSPLVLEFPSGGFKMEVADNNPPYYYFTNEKAKLNLSFSFERATKCNGSEACRDYFANEFSKADASRKIWQLTRIGEVFVSESQDGSADSSGTKQQYMNAHFVKDGMWINVRLSKADYTEADRDLFVKLVRSIQFWPKLRE